MNLALNLLSDNMIQAIGWTLLHSLWQGALIALILIGILTILNSHSSKTRYTVAGGALIAQVAASVFTFFYFASKYTSTPVLAITNTAELATTVSVNTSTSITDRFWQAPLSSVQLYAEQYMPLLVTLWLIGLTLMALRFFGGLAYTQRLKKLQTKPLPAHWQQKALDICQELKISKPVRLVESALVQVPMAIGYAKPVILFPMGAITGLSNSQLEAILAHELAHIMRRDYLHNILQAVVDILFFYHPAMWWISGIVRAERENCCDDIAVAICGNHLTYARALAELEAKLQEKTPALAMAFSGKRHSLMSRIKRLLGQPALRPSLSEGFAAVLLLAVGLSVISFGTLANLKPAEQNAESQEHYKSESFTSLMNNAKDDGERVFKFVTQDTTGQKRDIVIIKNKKGEVTKLYVDGKRIPKKDIPAFNDLIEQRLEAIEKAPKASKEEISVEMEKERKALTEAQAPDRKRYEYKYEVIVNGDSLHAAGLPPLPPLPSGPRGPRTAPLPPMPPIPPMPPLAPETNDKEAMKKYNEAVKKHEKEMQQFKQQIEEFEAKVKSLYETQEADAYRLHRDGMNREEIIIKRMERNNKRARMHEERAVERKARAEARHARMEEIKKEMIKDGILEKETSNLSIQITDDSFIVNGKKQPKEVHEKYKKLMQVDPSGETDIQLKMQIKE